MKTIEETMSFMKNDVFAIQTTGCIIDEIGEDYAKCSLKITKNILNAENRVQGGAIYTLADYTYGVASRGEAVTQTSQITYLSASKGDVLYAESKLVKDGRTVVFYETKVTDDKNTLVAFVTTSGFKLSSLNRTTGK